MGKLNPQQLHRMYQQPSTIAHGFPLPKSGRYLEVLFSYLDHKYAVIPVALMDSQGDFFEMPRHGLRPSSRTDLVFPYEIEPYHHEPRNKGDMIDLAQRWAYSEADPQPHQRY
jgi:hypothetical protein